MKKSAVELVGDTLIALGRKSPPKEPVTVEIILDPSCPMCRGTGISMHYANTGRREWSYEGVCSCVAEQIREAK